MAARNRPGLSEATRLRIKTSMLVERLQKHILGEVELSTSQVRSIEILLNRTLPTLSAVHSTDDREKSLEDWLAELETDETSSEEA